MRTKSIILLLVALGFGLVASFGMSQLADSGSIEEVATSPVYVTLSNISMGERFNEENVKLEQWPADRVPEGAMSTPEQLENMVPTVPLFPGEPLIAAKCADADSFTAVSKRIKPGHRVMSVKVAMDTSVSGLIVPGDHVDIMAVDRKRGKAETVLSNIEVFAVNSEIKRRGLDEESAIQAKTISVQVLPEQAEVLTYYDSTGGNLRLSLRSEGDDEVVESTDSFDPVLALRDQLPEQSAEDNSFKMQVVGGDGKVQEYTWDDSDSEELPNEVNDGSAPSFGGTGALPPFGGSEDSDGSGGDAEASAEAAAEEAASYDR